MKTAILIATLAALVEALALSGPGLGQVPWFISRASGVAAFLGLSASVMFGLLMSTRAADGLLSRPLSYEMHKFLSVFTVALIGLHGGALLFDGFLHFTPLSVLVPFTSPHRPLWVGLGVIGGWASALVTASFWMRRRIGRKNWRRFHYVSFLAYVLALVHGATSGTDRAVVPIAIMYATSASLVTLLLAYRILNRKPAAAKAGRPAMQPAR
jgi:predicted ferric reductase